MLIEPASKVSVPLTVVMRTVVRASDSVFVPEILFIVDASETPNIPDITQIFPLTFVKIKCPVYVEAATLFPAESNPTLNVPVPTDPPETDLKPIPVYPDVSTELPPNLNLSGLVPLVDTALNITVIRFTQDGIEVKSTDVPLVDATAVPEVNG
jgi:hypothetical protein